MNNSKFIPIAKKTEADKDIGFDKSKVFKGVDRTEKKFNASSIANEVFLWSGILAVIVIIVSGIFYATSGGDSSKVARAKNALTYSIVGLIIIMLSFAIVKFVLEAI